MDINNRKINKISKVFDGLIGKSNTYIPALHKKSVDTFESTTKNVSFKGNILTKDSILSRIENLDIPESLKQKLALNLETQEQITFINKLLSDVRLYENEVLQEYAFDCLSKYDDNEAAQTKLDIIDVFMSNENLHKSDNAKKVFKTALSFAKKASCAVVVNKILSDHRLYNNDNIIQNLSSIISWSNYPEVAECKLGIIEKYLSESCLNIDEDIQNTIGSILQKANGTCSSQIALQFLSSPDLYRNKGLLNNIPDIISAANTEGKADVITGFLSMPELYENDVLQESIQSILFHVKGPEDLMYSSKLFEFVQKGEIDAKLAVNLIKSSEKVRYKQVRKLKETVSPELFSKISSSPHDLVIASNLISLYGKNNINEIPLIEKRSVLRELIQNNADLFLLSNDLKQAFPLIPKNRDEYCTLLPALVKSLGIETKQLSEDEVSKFNQDLNSLSIAISELSEEEFQDLDIELSYTKEKFIEDTLSIVKNLSKSECQKVYDYFGFEIKQSHKNPNKYSLYGYPVNINNGHKLAQITDEKTRKVVEILRQKVIEFSEKNPIKSNNPEFETLLGNIIDALPELNTMVKRKQHGAHEYDVLKHSLKVMQKIIQNPQFENLNESDKKVMLLASLFHDITKAEGISDPNHATESSFDAFYIAKKFNLSTEEQTKLYTLIDTHEWLRYVNQKDISDKERIQRLQFVAFDLHNDNLFELSKIFTEADIKAIRKNNGLYELFGPVFNKYSKKIEEYIFELKNTKPILPITKLPKASDVKSKITTVNSDCSTDVKGVYICDDVVVVKYNEVENWAKLGFPSGCISRGIELKNPVDEKNIDTGNIKFIAHGFDEANQLSNFNAFNLPDSDALLSVSYMERPESKYRLFRTQGVLLDVDSNNVCGGGESDAGSGYKKSVSDFKLNYIFGGERQNDRCYISNLIKENLGLTDEEYIEFINLNSNKSMDEIEPVEIRERLIKCFALINSNVRRGDREYNEMYVSNPTVQGCFAYSAENSVGNISDFLSKQPGFLKDYAKQNNLLFFVFGD